MKNGYAFAHGPHGLMLVLQGLCFNSTESAWEEARHNCERLGGNVHTIIFVEHDEALANPALHAVIDVADPDCTMTEERKGSD